MKEVKGRAMVLSEFGGYACKIEGHAFNPDNTYGYRFFKSMDDFENALVALYKKEVIPTIEKGLCATILTQVSDVEDETNGLLTYDRRVLKVNSDRMKKLSNDLYSSFEKKNQY